MTPLREDTTSSEEEEQEGDELPSPELSKSEDESESEDDPEGASAPKESPKEAAAPTEERKEVPSSTPPSEQSQPAEAEETKEESMSPKTSPKRSHDDDTASVISDEHDTDDEIEMVAESPEQKKARVEKRNAGATFRNMPKDSTDEQREDWPKVWLDKFDQQQERLEEKQEQVSSFLKRPMTEDLNAALKLLGLPEWTNFTCIEYMNQTEDARTKNFKTFMNKYHPDKIERPNSDKFNPDGEDCSTPEKKTQAWKDRVHRFVNAKDTCNDAAKWGVKELQMVNGKPTWI